MKVFSILVLLVLAFSCNQDQGPEQVLRGYINQRFQSNQNFKDLISKTTGELKANLEALSPENRKKFDQSSQFKKKGLKIISKDYNDKTCDITYIISYEKKAEGNPYNAQIRNIAKLENVEGDWKISSVGGLKSHFESKKDIEP